LLNNQAVYLDTSILIAIFINAPKIKIEIREKFATYSVALTGQLVEQEFTRRLLKEAEKQQTKSKTKRANRDEYEKSPSWLSCESVIVLYDFKTAARKLPNQKGVDCDSSI